MKVAASVSERSLEAGAVHSLTLMATGWGERRIGEGGREREGTDPEQARSIRSRSWLRVGPSRGLVKVAASVSERSRGGCGPFAHAHGYGMGRAEDW